MTTGDGRRRLIVNADDLGQSRGINVGVTRAHCEGIVTSASLMVRWPAAVDAAKYATRSGLDLGLHVDLGEYAYRDGRWVVVYEVVAQDESAISAAVESQLGRFRQLTGRDPSHLDSHQHVHLVEPVRSILKQAADRLNVPLRHFSLVHYEGRFYGQDGRGTSYPEGITVEALLAILASLPPGLTELGCHPGEDGHLDSMYVAERAREVEVLCDARVQHALQDLDIELVSFRDLPAGT